jgi:uncharacterized protein DUF6297
VSPANPVRERPVPAGPVLEFVRERRRAHRPLHYLSDRFADVYTLLLCLAYVGFGAYTALRQDPTSPGGADVLIREVARWSPAALMLGLVAAMRYATWQGPVLFALPDVEWLLSAPLSHAELVRHQLSRGLALGAVIGTALGLIAFIILGAELAVPSWPLLGSAIGGFTLLGVFAAALGWLIECSASRARIVARASPLALPLAAGVVVVSTSATGSQAILWSGPWGWALGPLVAAAGGPSHGWLLQMALLTVAAAASVAIAWRRSDAAPTEELARRGATRSGLIATLYMVDLRGVTLLAREATQGLRRARGIRLPRPRSPSLAIFWRDALSALRTPGRAGWALLLVLGGVVAMALAPDRQAVAATAVLAGYFAAARLVEVVRLEADEPDAHRVLPWGWGQLLLLHCAVPVLILTALGLIAVSVGWLAGILPSATVWPGLALCPLVAAVLVACGAISGQRGPFPVELLFLRGDMGPMVLVMWLATGPILAEIALGVPIRVISHAADGIPLTLAVVTTVVSLGLALVAAAAYLRTRRQRT